MPPLDAILTIAIQHHQAGRWPAAADAYRQALAVFPHYAEVHYNLASVLRMQGLLTPALNSMRRALELKPDFVEAHNDLASILKDQGDLEAAINAYQHALRIKPDYAEAHNNLAGAYQLRQDFQAAHRSYQTALQLRPDFFEAHFNLGMLLASQKRFTEAIVSFERALQLSPDQADAYFRLGQAHQHLEHTSAALMAYREAIRLQPNFANAYFSLGEIFQSQGELDAAGNAYRQAIAIRPDFSSAINNLGNVFLRQGRLAEAVTAFQAAGELNPKLVVVYNNLASAFKELREFSQSEAAYLHAIELDPAYAEAHANLANLYLDLGRTEEAIAHYRKAIELKPDFDQALSILVNQLQHVCDWQELAGLSKRLIDSVECNRPGAAIAPFPFLGLLTPTTPEQQWKCATHWAEYFPTPETPIYQSLQRRPAPSGTRKLRIGYLSADFRTHAVAFMIPEWFEEHDRTGFTVFGYSTSRSDGSSIRKRIEASVDAFRDIEHLSFLDAARTIAADEIDILVDLQGYTTHARTEILALRPAPVQVSYIGFPGTMGARFIDYILADDYVLPIEQQPFYTERIVHLPGCYQVNDSRHEIASQTPTRHECGLPNQGFVFCSFNNSYKISPRMFDVWMRLLQQVPASILWLSEYSSTANHNLQREADKRGVAAERLVFAPRLPIAAHLARHRLADLFLDSFPYNAHATASIALRMGVPMVTLSGETFAARVAGSLLRAVGLTDWIARDYAAYESMALKLATDRGCLTSVRDNLQRQLVGCRLYDGRVFARNVEKAYAEMWRLYQGGQPPAYINVDGNRS